VLRAPGLASLLVLGCAASDPRPPPLGVDGGAPAEPSPVAPAPAPRVPASAPAVEAPDAGRAVAALDGGAGAVGGDPAVPAGGARDGDMRLVPAGTFVMGSETGERDERPPHPVTLAAFWLDETEVTNEAYGRCVAAGKCRPPSPRNADLNRVGPDSRFRGARQPISSVSWDDARNYCSFVGKRLPREAELERAARGDDGRRYPWGNEPPTSERATFSSAVTSDVGAHPGGAGPWGHLDLAGNVWEWCEDVYDPYAYTRPGAMRGEGGDCRQALAAQEDLRRKKLDGFTGTNPIPEECERVLRGGAFNYDAPGLRSSNRVHHPGRFRLVMSGLRCARDVASP
jgi:formylglycine-generating enzyme required for sulfatase activity